MAEREAGEGRPTMTSPDGVFLPFESRHTALRPPSNELLGEIYRLAVTAQIPWHWNGAAETPDAFSASLRDGVLVVYAIEARETGRQIGLLTASHANIFHGFAYTSMYLLPEFQMKAWPNEAALLFANYLFTRFNLRNLYAESATPSFDQFKSGAGHFFDVEGHFQERVLMNGTPQDLYVLRLSRAKWDEVGVPLLLHCTTGRRRDAEAVSGPGA